MRRGIRRELSSTELMFGWRTVLVARRKQREKAGLKPGTYKRKAWEEKRRSLALLEMTPTETAAKSQKEGRAEARPYIEQFPT